MAKTDYLEKTHCPAGFLSLTSLYCTLADDNCNLLILLDLTEKYKLWHGHIFFTYHWVAEGEPSHKMGTGLSPTSKNVSIAQLPSRHCVCALLS